MSHAEKCPLCDGKGKLPGDGSLTGVVVESVCHGCDGKGWVEVSDGTDNEAQEMTDTEVRFVTNDPIIDEHLIDEHCDNVNKPIAGGGL